MDSLEKKISRLPPELQKEVMIFVDSLIARMNQTKSQKDEKTASKAPPTAALYQKTPKEDVPATPVRKPFMFYHSFEKDHQDLSTESVQVGERKTENGINTIVIDDKETEDSVKLFPCPYCKFIVQDNWDTCPSCHKLLKTPAKRAKPTKKH